MTSVNYIDSSSFIQLITPPFRPSINVTISFTTRSPNGVLVYHGKERKHLAVEVFKGRLRISYDVGNHPASTMFRWVRERPEMRVFCTVLWRHRWFLMYGLSR